MTIGPARGALELIILLMTDYVHSIHCVFFVKGGGGKTPPLKLFASSPYLLNNMKMKNRFS